jgi:hypothetical protein
MNDETGTAGVAGRSDRSPTLGQLAAAKARAQAAFTPLGKDKTADIATRTGGKYSYAYADLATCLEAVIPALSKECIALFQPTRIEDTRAIATTLLVHESGEFISSDFAVAIVDPSDARSVGSAATYSRRYGLLSMLGYASGDGEDDDGEAARGGQHEQKAPANAPACPVCGVIGSLMKSRPEWGGGIVCWAKRDGCGAKWPADTVFPPTAPPPTEPAPAPTSGKRGKRAAEPAKVVSQSVTGDPAPREESPSGAPVAESLLPPPGSEDCEVEGCWGGRGHEGNHVFDTDAEALKTPPVEEDPFKGFPRPAPAPLVDQVVPTKFMIQGSLRETAGMTESQFLESLRLATKVDKGPLGKGYARKLLAKLLHVPVEEASRTTLTEAKAAKYLKALEQASLTGEDVEVEP